MVSIILVIMKIILWAFTVLHFVSVLKLSAKALETKDMTIIFTLMVTAGLFIDGLVISMGTFMGESSILYFLNRVRYIAHGWLVPFILIICAYICKAGTKTKLFSMFLTALLSVLGIVSGGKAVLIPAQAGGVVRYTVGEGTPVWAEISVELVIWSLIVPVILAGIYMWVRHGKKNVLLGGIAMLFFEKAGELIGLEEYSFFISMIGEVILTTVLEEAADEVCEGESSEE